MGGVRKILDSRCACDYFTVVKRYFALKIREGIFRCFTRKYARKVQHSELHRGSKLVNPQGTWYNTS